MIGIQTRTEISRPREGVLALSGGQLLSGGGAGGCFVGLGGAKGLLEAFKGFFDLVAVFC